MNFESIRKVIYRNEYHKKLLVLIILVIVFLYFKIFFSIGVFYDETFLKRKFVSNERHYIGSNEYGTIDIAVKFDVDNQNTKSVVFNFPNNSPKEYIINYNKDNLVGTIKNENEKIIFEENYDTVTNVMGQGAKFITDNTEIRVKKSDNNIGYYYISIRDIVSFSKASHEEIRGDVGLLIGSIFLATFYFIDLVYPLFFFKVKHILSVRNPEPSDLYIKIQKISWYIYPFIIFIMLFYSLKFWIL